MHQLGYRVELSAEEMDWARRDAERIRAEDRKLGLVEKDGRAGRSDRDGMPFEILGAEGELAVAKAFGFKYGYPNRAWGKPDVGDCYEVRTRGKPKNGLIVKPRDPVEWRGIPQVGILVWKLDTGVFAVMGWYPILDGKNPRFWEGYYGHYNVPTHLLNRFEMLLG